MNDAKKDKAGLKQKIAHEMFEYFINFVYLAFFFVMFTSYRRLILAEYQISYLHYGISIIQALILAKVVMVGDILRLGRRLEDKPLIFPTLYKTIVFCVWVGVFGVIEHTIGGLLHGKGLAGGFEELMSKGKYELFAQCLVIFFAFIPFFAFRELERVLGEGKIHGLLFRRRTATEPEKEE